VNEEHCNFIIGHDDKNSKNVSFTCDEKLLANGSSENYGNPSYLTPIYFKKEVLQKYYNNSEYSVEDGLIRYSDRIVPIDNDCESYVVVFLGDLGKLPYEEQLYWRSFNITPQRGMSKTGVSRSFLAEFTDPQSPDLVFKQKYTNFNTKWKHLFGWDLFKPLNLGDKHRLDSLHGLTSDNNHKEFKEQILAITIILIDSINEQEVSKHITVEKKDKGIDKFDKYLKVFGISCPDVIDFLKKLQLLRSQLVAHREGSKQKDTRIESYFSYSKKSQKEILNDILIKGIHLLDILQKMLNSNENI